MCMVCVCVCMVCVCGVCVCVCVCFVHTHRSYVGETRSVVTPEPFGDALENKECSWLTLFLLVHNKLPRAYYHYYPVIYCTCSSLVLVICQTAISHC